MGLCCGGAKQNPESYQQKSTPLPKVQRSQKPVNYQQRLEYILDFWFRMDDEVGIGAMLAYDRESSFPSNLKRRWFKPDDSFDAMVRQNFKQDFDNLEKGLYSEWEKHHDGRLALIILTDQLSRMYYRNQKEQFKYDHIALKLSIQILKNQNDFNKYQLIERLFLVFPLMHSERKQDSELLVEQITLMIMYGKSKSYGDVVETLASFLKAAQTFTQILTVYGRFPHRNQLMMRQDTADEVEFNKIGKIPPQKMKQFGLKTNQDPTQQYKRQRSQGR